jgi:glycosyltransferase involved in cell wall biosynthesis
LRVFCSIIIPTIGRDTLPRAVLSVLGQDLNGGQYEVIVVNDSGRPLSEADWQLSPRVVVVTTNRRERSVARNVGAAIAQGTYLGFLDDDDWLLPGALRQFWQLAERAPQADWLYGGIRVVDHDGATLGESNSGLNGNCSAQILGGAWAPIQSSLVRASALFRAGGFNPFWIGTEDLDLCRRVALRGTIANTPAVVACLSRGRDWKTSTNYLVAPEQVRRSRDAVVAEPGAFRHILASVRSGAHPEYWHGRVFRVYMTLALMHLRNKRLFEAASRAGLAGVSLAAARKSLFSSSFWSAARAEHTPNTLHHIMAVYERNDRTVENSSPPEHPLRA